MRDSVHGRARQVITTLLIDDDPVFRQTLRDGLLTLNADLHIEEAADGEAGRRMIERNRPDVIIIEMNLPLENGVHFTRWVKHAHPSTKVIIVSALCPAAHLVVAAEAGAECFVTKGSLCLTEIVELIHTLTAL